MTCKCTFSRDTTVKQEELPTNLTKAAYLHATAPKKAGGSYITLPFNKESWIAD